MCANVHDHDDPRFSCDCHLVAIEHDPDDDDCRCADCRDALMAKAEDYHAHARERGL